MSMNTCKVTGNTRVCAACALWGGERHTDALGSLCYFASSSTKGTCQGGAFNTSSVQALASCSQWQKWAALRG